uniref:F-box domain-containing protein n=1 Tax=Oryza nivara TaxID=4536 RepID=A0A0E0HW67_ORYNI
MAAPAPELMDDVVEEILLRLPLDDPSCAARASAVCKHWRHLLADAGFLRRYRAFHRRRAPPRLGFIYDAGSPLARVLAGDGAVYFLTWHGRNILRYDLRKLDLTVIASPEIDDDDFENHLLMTTEDGGMGLARLVSGHSLQLWSWKPVSAAAAWVQLRVIDLDLVIPGDAMRPRLLGFAEGTDMVFVDTTYDGAQVVQQIELSTLKVTKVLDECYASCVLPYMSFFLPGRQKGKLPPSAITL